MRDAPHGVEHFLKQAAADGFLGEFGGNVQAADQAFLIFEDIKTIAGGSAVVEGDTASQGAGVQKALDEFERAAVVPMQFVAPMARLFFEERLNLADSSLSQIDDVHG